MENPNREHNKCRNCWHSEGTRYNDSSIPWNNIGYIYKLNDKRDTFYNFYEKSLDSARDNYRYYVHDTKQDVKIMLNNNKYIQANDTININGKNGGYKVYKYDMEHPSYPLGSAIFDD